MGLMGPILRLFQALVNLCQDATLNLPPNLPEYCRIRHIRSNSGPFGYSAVAYVDRTRDQNLNQISPQGRHGHGPPGL